MTMILPISGGMKRRVHCMGDLLSPGSFGGNRATDTTQLWRIVAAGRDTIAVHMTLACFDLDGTITHRDTLLPLVILDLIGMYLLMDRNHGAPTSRLAFAVAEGFLTLPEQFGTIAIFLMYLGLAQNSVTKLKP